MSLYIYLSNSVVKQCLMKNVLFVRKMIKSKLNDLNKPPNESCPCLNHLPNVIVKTMSKCIYININIVYVKYQSCNV